MIFALSDMRFSPDHPIRTGKGDGRWVYVYLWVANIAVADEVTDLDK